MTTAARSNQVAGTRRADPLLWLTGFAMLLAAARGIYPGWGTPLWLDETFTATIATQTNAAALIDWCLHELSGPVYYTLAWAWTHMFGASANALRIPSLVCTIATPLLIFAKGPAARNVRLLWAVLLMLWMPALTFASEARPYALLLLLATGQVILFHRLMLHGGRRNAVAWSSLTALLILTHYHALVVSGLQGLIYLIVRRSELRATWPGALVFVPVGLWMTIHLRFVLAFASPGVAGYDLLTPADIASIPVSLAGGNIVAAILLVAMAVTLSRGATAARDRRWFTPAETAVIAASIVAALVVIGVGFIKPSFIMRYLTPFAPGIFFGLAVWTHRAAQRLPLLAVALMAATLTSAGSEWVDRVRHPDNDVRYRFSLDGASDWLRGQGAERLIFFWDNTTASISTGARTGEVGSYFLRERGWQGPVIVPPIAGNNVDPNVSLSASANQRGDAVIWAYDRLFAGTLALRHPPRLGADFDCRDFGRKNVTVLACIRR